MLKPSPCYLHCLKYLLSFQVSLVDCRYVNLCTVYYFINLSYSSSVEMHPIYSISRFCFFSGFQFLFNSCHNKSNGYSLLQSTRIFSYVWHSSLSENNILVLFLAITISLYNHHFTWQLGADFVHHNDEVHLANCPHAQQSSCAMWQMTVV